MTKNIKIQLYGKVEGYLTLTEDSDFPFTLALADIKDLSKRKSTTSKSINIDGTDENNKLLGYYFDVNLDPNELSFNINKIQKCCIYVNDDMFMDNCIMQLTEIQKVQPNSQREYSIKYVINIKSNQADFFGSIQNKNLEDIELSTKDIPGNATGAFTYNANFVRNSFNNTYVDGYKFIYQKTTNGKITLPMFKPAVYLWTYFNRIIKDAGFRYTFPEIGVTNSVLTDPTRDDLFFRKLLIPFTNKAEGTTMDNVVNYAASASRVGPAFQMNGLVTSVTISPGRFQYPGSLPPASIIPNTNEINDPSNSYTPTQYTAQYTGVLNININQRYQAFINNNNAFDIFTRYGFFNDGYAKFKVKNRIYKNGIDTGIETISGNVIITSSAHTWTASSRTSIGIDAINTNLSVSVVPGDVVTVATSFVIEEGDGSKKHFMIDATGNLVGSFRPEVDIQTMSLTYSASIPNAGLSYGGIIDLNNFIPQKIKQNDFLKSILNMHNIYVYSDKYDDNLLHFTTRDNYYDTGVKKNFTSKFCKDMEHTDQFLSELSNKEMYMSYKQDKNIDNEEYFNEYNKTYGSATFIFDNEYVKGEDKLEIIFSPSPINMDGDKYVTDLSTPDSLRLLFDGGESSCNAYNIVNFSNNELTVNTYPITTHLNNPNIPTYDLNWGTAQSYFHAYSSITNNNLINIYWRRTLHQINKSRLLTCYLNLSEVDIRNINLNDIIYIDNTYYYINKIIDFNPVKSYKTKVELISIDDLQNTTKGIITNWGDTKPAEPWVPNPNGGTIKPSKYDNIIRDFTNGNAGTVGGVIGIGNVADSTSIIIGNYSVADGKGSIVIGDKSFISGSMNKSLGDNNIVNGNNVSVSGVDNNILSNNVIVNGDNNILQSPGIYLGSNITAPTNLNNVLVVGDNITPTGEGIWADSINGIPAASITSPDLATVLANGNTTSGNSIIMSSSSDQITSFDGTSRLTFDSNYFLGNIDDGIGTNALVGLLPTQVALVLNTPTTNTSYQITPGKLIMAAYDGITGYDYIMNLDSNGFTVVENIGGDVPLRADNTGVTIELGLNLGFVPVTNNTNTMLVTRNATTGNIELRDVSSLPGGSLSSVTTISANATISNVVTLVDTTSTTITVTLPTAVGISGKQYTIKDKAGNAGIRNITIATTSSQTIDGSRTHRINTAYESINVISNGSNWYII